MCLDKLYDKNVPTVFVIGSPFQAICTVSAILNLQILDYKVIVIFSDRYLQVKSVLNRYNIPFILKKVGKYRWRMRLYMVFSLFHRKYRWKRLFVGDYRSKTLLYFGLMNVSDSSTVIYLDDGNASIPLFDGTEKYRIDKYLNYLALRRNVILLKHFFSIYTGFVNEAFDIRFNDISVLGNDTNSINKSILFIGTNSKLYCESLIIDRNNFYSILEDQIKNIKRNNPDKDVIYIPHGKDSSEEVLRICNDNSVQYKRLDVPVEMVAQSNKIEPIEVYGFTSSALFNLKKMYPQCEVYNILITPKVMTNLFGDYVSISDYYTQNGILKIDVFLN